MSAAAHYAPLLHPARDRHRDLDRLGLGPGPQVVHTRLEPLFPAVKVHTRQLGS
jgi:hypothetical protein